MRLRLVPCCTIRASAPRSRSGARASVLRAVGVLGAVLPTMILGCSDGPGSVDGTIVVTISPAADTLAALGTRVRFLAVARDAHGTAVTGLGFTWTSSDPEVAVIDPQTGWAEAVANGTVSITATAERAEASVPLVVRQRSATVTLLPTSAAAFAGDAVRVLATVQDANGVEITDPAVRPVVTWSSSNPAVAAVDETGLVTAASGGLAAITAAADGQSATAAVTVPARLCGGDGPTVALVVDSLLAGPVADGKAQFATDLCADGYAVVELASVFADPVAVREYLRALSARPGIALSGTILVGAIPHAYQWVRLESANPSIPSTEEEVISFQYYADLDGDFERAAGYRSPGGHDPYSYNLHTGDRDWEIWVGVLPLFGGDYAGTADAINRYFAKNHAYREGLGSIPRAFLEVSEHYSATTLAEHQQVLGWMTDGQYAWTPWSASADAHLYFHSEAVGMTVVQGYTALSDGVADFFVGDAHGYWGAHGQMDIAWVEANPVRTSFFWSNGCAVGDLDRSRNFLTSVLYSETSEVVLARGTTNNSGGMGSNQEGFFGHNVATHMSQGYGIGDAVIHHVNVPLQPSWLASREFHIATSVFLGDPSLRIRD